MNSSFRRYCPLLIATAILLPHAWLFDFVTDDAYISFRYARNLALHGQLVFNLGERVEGFTNFLWTVLLALGFKFNVGPITASRFLGIAFAVGTLAIVNRMSLQLSNQRPSAWHFVAPVVLSSMGAFACWSTGGLETQLFTFLVTLGFHLLLKEISSNQGQASAAIFALAAMTRPEGAFLFVLAAIFRFFLFAIRLKRIWPQRLELSWLGIFLLLFLPYYVWRWHYFGYPLPNTFYVKSAGGQGTWLLGFFYLRRFIEDYGIAFFILLAFIGWSSKEDLRRKDLRRLTLFVWLSFAAYVVNVGGDFMGLYRFILPILPLGALTLQESLSSLWQRLHIQLGSVPLGLGLALISIGFLVASSHTTQRAITFIGAENGIDSPAYLKKYAEERIAIGQWFGRHRHPDDLMTVGGAGVIPYYSEIPAYDVFGLVDKTIAHDPHMTISNRPGHQKWGSDQYMLSRNPTLITHYYCLGTVCPVENGPAQPGFEWVRAEFPGPRYYSFQKRLDRSIGPFPKH